MFAAESEALTVYVWLAVLPVGAVYTYSQWEFPELYVIA
jgi:hypothetical protein